MKKLNVVLMGAALLLTACGGAKESSQEAKVMKLGGIGPLTGPLAIYGENKLNILYLMKKETKQKLLLLITNL